MIDSLIFDLDGVLVFTDKYHYAAWKEMADDLGVYFDEKINNRLRGVSRMESLEIILERYEGPALSKEEKEALAQKKNNIYRELLKKMSPDDVSEDVRFTLKELKKRGMHLAIGSSSKNAKLILDKVGLMDSFEAISDGENISRSKPDPEVFIKAALFMDKRPEACMVVEDAFSGIEAAKAAGMKATAIGDARNSEKADYKIEKLSDLLNLIAV